MLSRLQIREGVIVSNLTPEQRARIEELAREMGAISDGACSLPQLLWAADKPASHPLGLKQWRCSCGTLNMGSRVCCRACGNSDVRIEE